MNYHDLKKMFRAKQIDPVIRRCGSGGAYHPTAEQLAIILDDIPVKEIQRQINISEDLVRRFRNKHGIFLTKGKKRITRNE